MSKRKTNSTPLLGQILKKIAPRIGARVTMEPRWNVVGQIRYKNTLKRYFRYSSLDINSLGSSEVAKDKDYANFFMKKLGYPTVPGSKTFFSPEWAEAIGMPARSTDAAYRYAIRLGFPVVVKPNSGSQGVGVSKVYTKKEFYRALRAIWKRDRVALVQRVVSGRDYRVVVLDGTVISAYERVPLNVVGTGKATIRELLKRKQRLFTLSKRDTRIKMYDPRIEEKLSHQRLKLDSVPAKGKRIFLLDNANLSAGGDSIDVTSKIHPEFKKLAIDVTRDMGLRLCGVDLMIEGDIQNKSKKFYILEINAAPGLDHYARSGKAQEKMVEELYLKVLRSME